MSRLFFFAWFLVAVTVALPARADAPAPSKLTVEEYMKAGIPAPDRPWHGDDYTAVATTLASLKQNRLLPRRGDRGSRAIFDRIVADGNLDLLRNTRLPVSVRIQELLKTLQGARQVLGLYLQAQSRGEPVSRELLEQLVAMVRLSRVGMGIADEYLATIDRADPTYADRLKGLDQVQGGLSDIASGAVTTLDEKAVYGEAMLTWFADAVAEPLKGLLPLLPPLTQKEILQRVSAIATKSSGTYQRSLERLATKLQP